ncbi:hypothetical protein CEP49_04500 [Mergibacter septicus]|uniref:hypothetical protein n=1 Tax=Mergibacter septicus TaxID=221402 RepID=UPI001178D2CA|nr:hypothetical protein [Mergibacter septicus]AWX13869.1 hypothetical protein CEP49_04500 [Mergibacter septicus]
MALIQCPDCGKKVSNEAEKCVRCGFPLQNVSLMQYQQSFKKNIAERQALNRQNAKIQLIWLVIFSLIIVIFTWWKN